MIVIPPQYKEVYEKSKGQKGFMGISLGKNIFQNPRIMKEYAEFYSNHYNEFFFLLGDDIKIYNYLAITGMTEERAKEKLMEERTNNISFFNKICSEYPNIKTHVWKDFTNDVYYENLKTIKEGYNRDTQFNKAVKQVTRKFLSTANNLKKLKKHRTIEEAVEIAKEYYLDELAMLNAIQYTSKGQLTENYPGILPLENEIQNNEFLFCKKFYKPKIMSFFEVHYKPTPLQIAFEEV